MATVVERTTKGGDRRLFVVFHAIDRDSGKGRKVWELVPTGKKTDANARKSDVEVALRKSGRLWPAEEAPTEQDELTLQACGEAWLEQHRVNLRDRVYDNYKASLDNHIYPLLGTRRMAALGPADVKELRDEMRKKKLSDDTIRAALSPLRGIVRDWSENGRRPNALAAMRVFGKTRAADGNARRKIVPPEGSTITAILEHAREDARDAITVAAASGLRRGELFGLRWRDVDFTSNELHVRAYNFGAVVTDGRFKTTAGERTVPLFASIRKTLLERKARVKFSRPDDYVFATAVGTATDPGNFAKRELKAAITAANKARKKKELPTLEPFTWHSLRHHAVSALISQGAAITLVARIAGHSDPAVTLRVYSHLLEGTLADAATRYDPLRAAKAKGA